MLLGEMGIDIQLLTNGATRIVLLIGRFAIKLPNCQKYRLFLHGLLSNLQERQFSACQWEELCPVLLSDPLGLFLVMRRARPLTDQEWETVSTQWFALETKSQHVCDQGDYYLPVEHKRDSFGVLDGKIVAIDYGS